MMITGGVVGFLLHTFLLKPIMLGFFGIGYGVTPTEKKSVTALEGIAGFDTSQGEGAISKVMNFDSALLSGDMGKIAQLMAPFTSAMNKQAGQQKKTTAEFGNRGGGTNGSMQAVDDSVHGNTYDEIAKLISGAKSEEAGMGMNLLNMGANANVSTFNMGTVMQKQEQDQWNDIMKSIEQVAAAAAGGAAGGGGFTGAAGGAMGGAIGAMG